MRHEFESEGLAMPEYLFPEMQGAWFALNPRQRKAIDERDHNRCQFPIQHECNTNSKRNERHHIKNQMAAEHAGLHQAWIDDPKNILTLCEHVHKEIIHPDTHLTLLHYRSGHKDAFKTMQDRRRQVMEDGRDYHFNVYDDDMRARAEELTRDAEARGWQFPPPSNHR